MTGRGGYRRRPVTAAITVAVGVVGLAAAWWLLTQGPATPLLSPAGSTVATFSGAGNLTTDRFTVREGWAIRWASEGVSFSYAIRGDRDFGTVVTVDEPSSGVTNPAGAGSYYLDITAQGGWRIEVDQGQ